MDNIENKIIKEIEKKNIHNKNYFWILSILIFTLIIVLYSYQTDTGIIAKQTINKELIVKNQENLKQLYKENKKTEDEMLVEVMKPSNQNIDEEAIVIAQTTDEPIENEEEHLEQEEAIEQENIENIHIEKINEVLEEEKTHLAKQNVNEKANETENNPILEKTVTAPTIAIPPQTKEEVVVTVTPSKQTDIQKIIEPKVNFNLTYCYAFEAGKVAFANSCEDRLNEFIKNNDNATQYEIIGLIDLEDVANLSNKGEINQGVLAKNRIIAVQEILKNKTSIPISSHFYYLKSELQTKGFILRAYF